MIWDLIKKEKFTSIQKAQAGLSKVLKEAEDKKSFFRVLRNNEPVGILMPNNVWESILEDLEAMNSQTYINSIKEARSSSEVISSEKVKKILNIDQ